MQTRRAGKVCVGIRTGRDMEASTARRLLRPRGSVRVSEQMLKPLYPNRCGAHIILSHPDWSLWAHVYTRWVTRMTNANGCARHLGPRLINGVAEARNHPLLISASFCSHFCLHLGYWDTNSRGLTRVPSAWLTGPGKDSEDRGWAGSTSGKAPSTVSREAGSLLAESGTSGDWPGQACTLQVGLQHPHLHPLKEDFRQTRIGT